MPNASSAAAAATTIPQKSQRSLQCGLGLSPAASGSPRKNTHPKEHPSKC